MNSITSLDSISDSDIEMRTARSQITISAEAIEPPGVAIGLDSLKENFTNIEEHTATAPSLDLLDRMRNSYRLLDLVIDSATNGSGKYSTSVRLDSSNNPFSSGQGRDSAGFDRKTDEPSRAWFI